MKVKNVKIMLLLVAVTVCFVGCSKDEPNEPKTISIFGTWEYFKEDTIYGNVYRYTSTCTFNSNRTFVWEKVSEKDGFVHSIDSIWGMYTLFDDKFYIGFWEHYYKTGRDGNGDYLIIWDELDSTKRTHYKVK